MTARREYPRTASEVLDPPVRFKAGTAEAVEAFAAARPWRGVWEDRCAKFRALHTNLNRVYGKQTRLMIDPDTRAGAASGMSCFIPNMDEIVLRGKLSVITYLHEYAHALGKDERGAVRWSVNLYRQFFPRSYARSFEIGHMVLSNANQRSC